MQGIETQVLKLMRNVDETDEESIGFELAVSKEYVIQIFSLLLKDGYILKKSNGKFKLTLKGKKLVSGPLGIRRPLIRW